MHSVGVLDFSSNRKEREKIGLFSCTVVHLEDVPVNDRPARIFHHFFPVLQFGAFAIIPQGHFADGVGRSDSIVIAYRQLEGNALK